MNWGCLLGHRWTKWEQKACPGKQQAGWGSKEMLSVTIEWQERKCLKCGFVQREDLR